MPAQLNVILFAGGGQCSKPKTGKENYCFLQFSCRVILLTTNHHDLTHGSTGIIGWYSGLPDSLISTYIAQCMGCDIGRIHMALRSHSVLDILLPSIIIIVQDYLQALDTYKCL